MKKTTLFFTVLLISACSWAQSNNITTSGYVPFHEYLQQHHPFKQNNPDGLREITIFQKIAYQHLIPVSGISSWTYSDSGDYYYDSLAYDSFGNTFTFNSSNSKWDTATQYNELYDSYYDLLSVTGQVYDSGNWVNSYKDSNTFSSPAVLSSAIYQTWSTALSSWVNVYGHSYIFDAYWDLLNEVYEDTASGALQKDSQYVNTYPSPYMCTETVTLSWNGATWDSSQKFFNRFDVNGNNNLSYVFNWNGSKWVDFELIYKSYNNFNSILEYTVQLFDTITQIYDINTYQEAYVYDYRNNVTQYENFNWDATNSSWTPSIRYDYDYDNNNNCTYESDSIYSGGGFVATDEYFYYYAPFTVSGINDLPKSLNVVIYPNPVSNGNVTVSLNADDNTLIEMNVYDASGQLINVQSSQLVAGANVLQLNLPNIAPGIYYLRMTDPEKGTSGTLSFVKQ